MQATITLTLAELAQLMERAMESEKYAINEEAEDGMEDPHAWRTARAEKLAERVFLGH